MFTGWTAGDATETPDGDAPPTSGGMTAGSGAEDTVLDAL
jgi:hypothetical protein